MKKELITYLFFSLTFFSFLATANEIEDNHKYLIVVDFSTATMNLIEGESVLQTFLVTLPRVTPRLPIEGMVTKIQVNAWWHPTERTREAYFKKEGKELPKHIPPGHPLNAMGDGKIFIDFSTAWANPAIRIHGMREKDREFIGQRISRGCIRLYNEDFHTLVGAIEGSPTKILFLESM